MPSELLVERILLIAERVPAGRVVSYGDVARLAETGPRQVGLVLSRFGAEICWWRIVNHAGRLPEPLIERAREHWTDEGTPISARGDGVVMTRARADLERLAVESREALAALDGVVDAPESPRSPATR